MASGSSDRSVFTSSSGSLTIGAWNYVAASWDGSTVRFYINGSAAGSTAATGTIGTYSTPLDLATYENLRTSGGSFFYVGQIDEVALYDTALSATQTSNHYSANHVSSNRRRIYGNFYGSWFPLFSL